MKVEQLCEEAGRLSRIEQADLISRLLAALGPPAYDVSDAEVARRIEETRDGTVEDISHDELLARLKHVPGS